MTLGQALEARLKANATVIALAGARVYPKVAPPGTELPFLTYQEVSAGDPAPTLDGPSVWTRSRIQVDAYSSRADQADALGLAIRAALDGYAGGAGNPIKSALFDDRRGLYDAAEGLHRASLDFIIWAQE